MVKFAKGCAITAVAIVALLLLLPGILGYVIKSNYQRLTALTPSLTQWQIKQVSYQQHWFSSDAVIEIRSTTPSAQATPLIQTKPIEIRQHIQHGPWLRIKTQTGTHNAIGLAYLRGDLQQHPTATPLIQATWGLNQVIQATLNLPAFHYQHRTQQYTVSPIQGHVQMDLGQHRLAIHLQGAQLIAEDAQNTAPLHTQLSDWAIDHQYRYNQQRWQSYQTLHAQQLTLAVAKQPTTALNGVTFTFKRYSNHNTSDLSLQCHVDHVKTTHNQPLDINLHIDEADNAALAHIAQFLVHVHPDFHRHLKLPHHDWALLAELLQHGLSIRLNTFQVPTANGPIQAHGQLIIPATHHNLAWFSPSTYLLTQYQHLDANLELELPKPWLTSVLMGYETEQWQQQLAPMSDAPPNIPVEANNTLNQLIHDRVFVKVGDDYRLQLALHHGNLLFNDTPQL